MFKETREDPGIPHEVNFVETSASQGQEAGKNSGFSVSLAHHGVPGVISGRFSVRETATKSLLGARHDYI